MHDEPSRHTIEHHAQDPDRPMIPVHNLEEIPAFRDECEEHEFWATHEFSDELWAKLPSVPESELPPTRPRREDHQGAGRRQRRAAG